MRISGARVVPVSACAALRTMLSSACVSCSASASISGSEMSKSATTGIAGNSACTTPLVRTRISCTLVDRYVGNRCGVKSRLTSDCSRSASPMITCVYSRSGALELAFQKLRRAPDAAERILDLVREISDQLAVGLRLLEQAFLAGDLELLVDMAKLQQRNVALADRVTVSVRCRRGLPLTPSSISCSVYEAPDATVRSIACASPPASVNSAVTGVPAMRARDSSSRFSAAGFA